MRRRWALLVAGAALGARPASAQEPRGRMTLAQAVERALRLGSEIVAARHGVSAANQRVGGAGAQRYPRLSAEANLFRWDSPLEVTFGPMGMGGMSMGGTAPLTARDQITSTITVTVAQPLSGLFVLNRLVAIERNGEDAARADLARTQLDTAQRAADAYLRVLQGSAIEAVASKSLAQVEAQLARAAILEKGGVLGHVDVLRLTSARDTARQGVLRARTGLELARAGLLLALELPAGTRIEPVDDLPDPPPPVRLGEGEAAAAAARSRPELKAAAERSAQALGGRGVALAQLFPNVIALGTYQHAEGMGPFQPKDAWFVGATLSWDIWDWGKNWSGVKEAEARAAQAAVGEKVLRDQVVFDAHRRLLEARTAYETLAPARSALQAAEEAYRIQSVRYAEGAATTTDLIDAEADLSRARTGYAQARYDYYVAQSALARSLGELPAGESHANR